MGKKKIFVLGNPLLETDSAALKIASELKNKMENVIFEFVESLSDLAELPRHLLVLDTVENSDRIAVIRDLGQIKSIQPVSGHDFDFAMEVKMLLKVGKIDSVTIIAVPAECEAKQAARHVELLIKRLIVQRGDITSS